ncbi:hypothetical protein [Acetobacter oeni]|uniref:Uncharacterized protein n=1 Tax=Acetobacter oeni TaxID=304077 RepID=A0A511XNQ6_9PROT|nr:hypothetical protein [Acetobacter oeni]MBB3884429.1 hypothetical protein [Acetobacter oeni]NHO20352.1 hypothetical protein [Acetobacter oeni]GBR09916.1 hypothetical protein AA21952_2951 [Acetobacter oeni LMG 21952]GEN64573.1 hypothetical protein AOE01nite_27970 [Acetobacter oeni]
MADDGVIIREPFNPKTDKRPSSHPHDPVALQDASVLSLGRIPDTPAAQELTERVSEALRPHLGKRSVSAISGNRDKGRKTRVEEVGTILGGVIRPGLKGQWVAVNEGSGNWFWKASRQLPFGHKAFWTKARAMQKLGLIEAVPGRRFKNVWGDMQGHAARLRATDELLHLARDCGCSADTAAQDWKLVKPAHTDQKNVALVQLRSFPAKKNGKIVPSSEKPEQNNPEGMEDVRAFMERLTGHLAGITITGCCQPALSARFKGTPRLHGRIYALGADNYQSGISKAERKLIRINGEEVAEVDVSASFLSIALALMNARAPDGDPYSLPVAKGQSLAPRAAIKQWFVVFFSLGKAPHHWSKNTSEEITGQADIHAITEAAFQRYPELQEITRVIPPEVRATLPKGLEEWAIGQFLTNVEAGIMRQAMGSIMDQGGTVLPLHDALMVPVSWSERAAEAIREASEERLGRPLRIG